MTRGPTPDSQSPLAGGRPRAEDGQASLDELFRRHVDALIRLGYLLTGSEAVAEDLVQDVFARLARRSTAMEEPEAYLRRSVVNAAHSWHRRRRLELRHARAEVPQHASLGARELADALRVLSARERGRRPPLLRRAVDRRGRDRSRLRTRDRGLVAIARAGEVAKGDRAMTDDSELEQRLRRDLAELGAVPEAKERERKVVRRRPPGADAHGRAGGRARTRGRQLRDRAELRPSAATRDRIEHDETDRDHRDDGPTTTTATPLPEPPPPTCCTTPGDKGILQQFAPTSASAWWAIIADNLKPKSYLARTVDGGRHWRDVKLPVAQISSVGYFLNADVAWVPARSDDRRSTEPVYRTLDGGRSWKPGGTVPSGCTLQFLDPVHGWCTFIGGALGSASVDLVRTSDGGSTWTLVSHTDVEPSASTPGSLPFGGEKTINFTSPSVGWAPFYNAGDVRRGSVYKSDDGGSRWHELPPVPFPAGAPDPSGSGLGAPVVQGSGVAMVLTIGGRPVPLRSSPARMAEGRGDRR